LSALNLLTDDQLANLRTNPVATVAQLVAFKDSPAFRSIPIDPAQISKLICVLLYPQHDPGPNCAWDGCFKSAPLDYYIDYPQSRRTV
jgi:hypothetical protein